MNKIKIGLIQQNCESNIDSNRYNLKLEIEKLTIKGAELIVLQELHDSIYFCQNEDVNNFDLAEKIPGPTTNYYSEIAKANNIVLITSLFEKRTAGLYHNTAVVFEKDGTIAGKYRKMHIPDDPQYYEKFYFSPGDLGFKSVKTKFGKVGPLICWDQWFPEAARLTALKGAQIIFYPTAIGWHPKEKRKFGKSQLESWITMQKSHAIANGTYVAAINRVGIEKKGKKKIEFWGNSMVIDPSGKIVAKAGNKKEDILVCEVDYKKIDTARQHWPFLRDRRTDFYKNILKNPEDE